MNKQEIEKAIIYIQNMDLSEFIDRDEACGVVDMVTKLLQHQLTNGWIPVSPETNPEKSDIYLLTFEESGNRYVERFYYSTINGWMMPVAWQDEGHIDNLIAWCNMPEPYKEDKDAERN